MGVVLQFPNIKKVAKAIVPDEAQSFLSVKDIKRINKQLSKFDSWHQFLRRSVLFMIWCLEHQDKGYSIERVDPDRKGGVNIKLYG
jgi:hypothetical protein